MPRLVDGCRRAKLSANLHVFGRGGEMRALAQGGTTWPILQDSLFAPVTGPSPEVYDWRHLQERFREIAQRPRRDELYFFRHGETEFNLLGLVTGRQDPALTPRGLEQARHLAKFIPQELDALGCSALRRSQQTMLAALADREMPGIVVIDPRLNEVGLGILEGKPRVHIDAFESGDIDFSPPGGETYREAAQRIFSSVLDFFEHLQKSPPSGVVAIFCHAGVLRILASLLLNPETPAEMFSLDIANAEGLVLQSDQTEMPDFWVRDDNYKRGLAR